jgi:hypothetical protein
MPWFEENGLFPGLAIGRGMPMPWFEENGLFPGRGMPCNGAGFSAGSAGFSAGFSATCAAGFASASVVLASGFGFSAFGFSAGFSFFGYAARSLAATGGAMVEEPLFTYSPSSSSFARATLVSIPSSLAMSYTRGSATEFLLSGANPKQGRPYS